MKLGRAALMIVALAPAAACQLLAGIGDDNFTVAADGAVAVVIEAGGEAAGPPEFCVRKMIPAKPGAIDAGDSPPFVFAIDQLSFEKNTDAGTPVGLDLDGVCTCFDGGPTANDGRGSCIAPAPSLVCDGVGGIDNGFAGLADTFKTFGSPITDLANVDVKAEQCGRQAVLLVLGEYNGLANDDKISFGPLVSPGIYDVRDGGPPDADPSCPGPGDPDAEVVYPATPTGNDPWSYLATGLEVPTNPAKPVPTKNVLGYVSNFDLVVIYPTGNELPVALAGVELDLGTPYLIAHLVPLAGDPPARLPIGSDGNALGTPTAFRLENGVVGGRVSVHQLLQTASAAATTRDDDSGTVHPGCSDPKFGLLKTVVCNAADIQADPLKDFKDAGCDALSLVFQFGAAPARLGRQHASTTPDLGTCDDSVFACP